MLSRKGKVSKFRRGKVKGKSGARAEIANDNGTGEGFTSAIIVRCLPDADAISRCEVELGGRFDVERRVPGVDVAHGGGAVFGGGVPVGRHLCAKGGFASLRSPVLGVGYEELLVTVEASLRGRGLAV